MPIIVIDRGDLWGTVFRNYIIRPPRDYAILLEAV
jgi:hypothetical protein